MCGCRPPLGNIFYFFGPPPLQKSGFGKPLAGENPLEGFSNKTISEKMLMNEETKKW